MKRQGKLPESKASLYSFITLHMLHVKITKEMEGGKKKKNIKEEAAAAIDVKSSRGNGGQWVTTDYGVLVRRGT